MTDDRRPCEAARALAAELALGVAEGADRGTALAHLAGCADCRAEVRRPDRRGGCRGGPGAGGRASRRLRVGRAGSHRATSGRPCPAVGPGSWRWRPPCCWSLGIGVGSGGSRTGRGDVGGHRPDGGPRMARRWARSGARARRMRPCSCPSRPGPGSTRSAPMPLVTRCASSSSTATRSRSATSPSATAWPPGRCPTDLDGEDIRAVSVIDDTGRVWCTGRFA